MSNRSKVEVQLFHCIRNDFPKLKIKRNDRAVCDGLEVDILIPSLKIAIECNGVFHYEPIYGKKRLSRSIKNDDRKKELLESLEYNFIIIKQDFKFSKQKVRYIYLKQVKPIIIKLT